MRIKSLQRMEANSSSWQWRTVESDTGLYYTFANGKGIHFLSDDHQFHHKVATHEKFSVCRTSSGTRNKLNRIFSTRPCDPTPENPWKL